MVLIHIKKGDESAFLHETDSNTPMTKVIQEIADIYNTKLRIKRLVSACEDLIQYGPLKPMHEHGYTEEELDKYAKTEVEEEDVSPKKEIIKNGIKMLLSPDPTGRRCGETCSQEYAEIVKKTLDDAQSILSKDWASQGKLTKRQDLQETLSNIKGAVMIAYPMGLPEYETVQEILDDNEDLTGSAASKEVILQEHMALWWAGKELQSEKVLSDYVGKNNKTKILAKIQRKGQGAPVREPPLNEAAQKEMMAYYYKKQEQEKKLLENDEDDYVNSPWANTQALKSHFNGVSNLKWKA